MLKFIIFGLGFVFLFEGLLYFFLAKKIKNIFQIISSFETKKIQSFSAMDDWQGLGKEVAEKLENGEAVEIKNPPKHLVEGGYIIKQKKGTK